jgi:hypothetical protein
MKSLFRLLCLFLVLFSFFSAGCDLFTPRTQAQDLTPVDSLDVFNNLINAYNTLDKDALLFCLDSNSFQFIPRERLNYEPWSYQEEKELTEKMLEILSSKRQIPPLILQVDTTLFSASEAIAYLNANYVLITSIEPYDTLAGGFELEIEKQGNYWYITEWSDVPGDTIFDTTYAGDSIIIDTLPPRETEYDWSDFKVYLLTEA